MHLVISFSHVVVGEFDLHRDAVVLVVTVAVAAAVAVVVVVVVAVAVADAGTISNND